MGLRVGLLRLVKGIKRIGPWLIFDPSWVPSNSENETKKKDKTQPEIFGTHNSHIIDIVTFFSHFFLLTNHTEGKIPCLTFKSK